MTTEIENDRREALARVLDPDAWALYDDPRMVGRGASQEELVKDSLLLADVVIESGLMVSHQWDRREYFSARAHIIDRTSRTGRCENVEDGMDGYTRHDPRCHRWPEGAISGTGCIE